MASPSASELFAPFKVIISPTWALSSIPASAIGGVLPDGVTIAQRARLHCTEHARPSKIVITPSPFSSRGSSIPVAVWPLASKIRVISFLSISLSLSASHTSAEAEGENNTHKTLKKSAKIIFDNFIILLLCFACICTK